MKVLSVVCARAGSKGLKNKCLIEIRGKMVALYAVEYSLSLGKDVKTVVSSDIEPLINYCAKNNIPCIKRDPKICRDESRIDDALADALEKEGKGCKYCSIVYGNIPTRYPEMFHEALRFLEERADYDCVVSMQNVEKFHPEWMLDYNEDIIPHQEELNYRRQTLPQKMIPDGHTFIFKSEEFYKKFKGTLSYAKGCRYSIFGDKVKPLINNKVIIDIDTERDLDLAKASIAFCAQIPKKNDVTF